MSVSHLPSELLHNILREAIRIHPKPTALLTVNSSWRDISLPLLHTNIKLLSYERLRLFSAFEEEKGKGKGKEEEEGKEKEKEKEKEGGVDQPHSAKTFKLCCAPHGRNVEIRLPGETPSAGVWKMIMAALRRCQQHAVFYSPNSDEKGTSVGEHEPRYDYPPCRCKGVKSLKLCLNSYDRDPDLHLILPALRQINPQSFEWCRPEPFYQYFTVAIVPSATSYICKAIPYWSHLRALNLSNISFPNHGTELVTALKLVPPGGAPIIPNDQSDELTAGTEQEEKEAYFDLTLSDAIQIHPLCISSIVLGNVLIRSIQLVDVYRDTIWGSRMQLRDVEQSLLSIFEDQDPDTHTEVAIKVIRSVVRCSHRKKGLLDDDILGRVC